MRTWVFVGMCARNIHMCTHTYPMPTQGLAGSCLATREGVGSYNYYVCRVACAHVYACTCIHMHVCVCVFGMGVYTYI